MPHRRLTGSRIREKRLDQGLRQAAVAQAVGISPSYLNLIEHNRRRIGGKLLSDLARVLGVETALLTDGADSDLLDQMRAAAALAGNMAEVSRADELAARYPGWSHLIAAQARRLAALEDRVQALNDRMAHDPKLSNALHEVISAVTAIRSSSSILVGQEDLDDDWQRRFHQNIHNDSVRLATSSEALIAYLEAPDADDDVGLTAHEKVEKYLAQTGFHLATLENTAADIDAFVASSGLTGSPAQLLTGFAHQYIADAAAMPLAAFVIACQTSDYDPVQLAARFQVPFDAVLRRMAHLPPDDGHPPTGLMICDSSGAMLLSKPVPGFGLPRTGGACPLWPVYGALARPTQPLRIEAALPNVPAARFLCYAVAVPVAAPRFDAPPVLRSTMLVLPDPPPGNVPPIEVGISCRICPRTTCSSRREPVIEGVTLQPAL
ncbi:short-chain fatty acyl-CoA regulator family protein [Cognatiyoonia sp. IB215182]|uniref:short-chain fatty acyl-CoA regulator family protein n=1 Tax=Cognatiyoonia sp. IB215182 TaxID=3097353 RepID=UPI002A11916E|nr:short-chain fatty acyl-CoA regulator family protein [Cognatiyoonia sp. IB215182]MDX8354480.1 short-chain fatty acyl-CoA regulator family protein [Cognatiyoonia sp. IB215182]